MINRLKDLERGDLNAQHDAISGLNFAECWGLDETGNWDNFRQDDDGNGTWDLNQNRTANTVNEITDISETAGPAWTTPVYNRAGNMTTIPQPSDPTTSYTATYDAWNRLVKIVDATSTNTVTEYEYDGVKRRIVKKIYSGGTLDKTRHLYYSEPSKWQVLEERVDASTDAEKQFVWGLRYQDDLVLRDRDTTGDGSLNERLYSLQDANWNMTSIANTTGSIVERYNYTAYGSPSFYDASFNSRASSSYVWETLFAGYRWDPVVELFHVRNRVFDSYLGNWLQRDPLGLNSGDLNLYRYVNSSPLNASDPTGQDCPACDILPWALGNQANNSPCILACCAQHDMCYLTNECTAASWAWNIGGGLVGGWFGGWRGVIGGCRLAGFISECADCNNDAMVCIASCLIDPSVNENADLYFCPQTGNFIRIGGDGGQLDPTDFDNMEEARDACCND